MEIEEKNPIDSKARELIRNYVAIAPTLNDVIIADIGVSVIEDDTYLTYIPSKKLDLKIKAGDKVVPGSAADRAMKEKKRITVVSTKANSRFGVPCIANAFPIFDKQNNAVGCIVISETTEIQEFIREASQNLGASSEQLSSAIQNLSSHTDQLFEVGVELDTLSNSMVDKVKNTDEILTIIHKIANQTNLLGLNASIEAARVGELGKGFGVVAEEVRKLSAQSSTSAKHITEVLEIIQQSMGGMNEKSNSVKEHLEQQVKVIQEIASASQELAAMAQELQTLANKMNSVEE